MRILLTYAALALVTGAGIVPTSAAANADPVLGTWKLEASKSTFEKGTVIKDQTRTYSQSGAEIMLEMKTVTADGKESTTRSAYQLNGNSFPVKGTPTYDSFSVKQITPNKAEFTWRKDGKVVGTTIRTVSKDGKTLTSTTKLTSADGHSSENRLVFDRQ